MSFLNNVIAGIDNTHVASSGENSSEFSGTIDTGSYILNAAMSGSLYGGVPNNKIVAFAGESATGKTFFVLGVIKQFLDDNPDGGVIYFDTEAAVTKNMMTTRGIDVDRVVISEPQSIEEFRTNAVRMLDSYNDSSEQPPMMMVLDSLGQLSTTKEVEDTAAGSETRDMTKAATLKATFRVLNLKLAKANVPMLVTNHVYEVVGSYIPTKEMAGGSGLKYTASQICFLSKKKEKDGKDVIGNIIKVRMAKSRLTKENKQIEVLLTYDKGLDRYYGLLELAEKYEIIKKVANRYEMPDGAKVYAKAILKEPTKYFNDELLARIDEAARMEFTYGSTDDYEIEEDELAV